MYSLHWFAFILYLSPITLWVIEYILYALCVLIILASGTWFFQILNWMNTWLNEFVVREGECFKDEGAFRGREMKEKDTAVHTQINFTSQFLWGLSLCVSCHLCILNSVYLKWSPWFATWAAICKNLILTLRVCWKPFLKIFSAQLSNMVCLLW